MWRNMDVLGSRYTLVRRAYEFGSAWLVMCLRWFHLTGISHKSRLGLQHAKLR